jgi:hypothetical protein
VSYINKYVGNLKIWPTNIKPYAESIQGHDFAFDGAGGEGISAAHPQLEEPGDIADGGIGAASYWPDPSWIRSSFNALGR